MRQILILLLFLVSIASNGQTLVGKVYDAETTAKGIRVYNRTQKILTSTDSQGNFSMFARVNDTLSFESLFHEKKEVILKEHHFESIAVFELKKIVNKLNEVLITKEPEQPVFEEEAYNTNLNSIIANDIKNNPHLYQPQQMNQGVNFIYLIDLVAKLFKKKRPPVIPPITYEQITNLFNSHRLINTKFLVQEMHIPKEFLPLFIEYCTAKELSSNLLKKEKEFYLLDAIIKSSEEYLAILDEFKKQQILKD